ncbi:hypothetical protein BIV59_14540 [Bacillus sp. MUM 13]|nr:hypothetical protein BIV59_14540 [Bacillus sp. MUM 13]
MHIYTNVSLILLLDTDILIRDIRISEKYLMIVFLIFINYANRFDDLICSIVGSFYLKDMENLISLSVGSRTEKVVHNVSHIWSLEGQLR